MLLRLLPIVLSSQPAPPTILFTLPIQPHPYTCKSLPLPPNLLAHQSLCLQEDIQCSNVLLGEKSSWISGVIEDVTFLLAANHVEVRLIDGTTLTVPLSYECSQQLRQVFLEVELSFACPAKEEDVPKTSISSVTSTSSTSSSCGSSPTRSSPSALLLSLFSPLLPSNQSQAQQSLPPASVQPPARVHRRQARSLLVDAYRRHILPLIKEQLPAAYLPWAINVETTNKLESLARLREEINDLLSTANVDISSFSTMMRRTRSSSSSSSRSSGSDSDTTRSPVTPPTSIFSPSACSTPFRATRDPSPQTYLLSIPPAHLIPTSHRNAYASQLAKLTQIASRLGAIKRLRARYDREEGKRRWLESLERGHAADRALRRAYSSSQLPDHRGWTAEPTKRSNLWRSWTAKDQERAESRVEAANHPAMMSPLLEAEVFVSTDDKELIKDLYISRRRPSVATIQLPSSPLPNPFHHEGMDDQIHETVLILQHGEDVPLLVPSHTDDSVMGSESGDEIEFEHIEQEGADVTGADRFTLITPPAHAHLWDPMAAAITTANATLTIHPVKSQTQALIDWERHETNVDPDVEVITCQGVNIVCA